MKKLLFAFAAFMIAANLMSQGIEFEHGTFAEALAKAKKENKLVFMDCYTTWCGPCKMLAKNVFPQKEVGDVFNKQFVNIKMDCEKGEGPEIAKNYGVNAFPTLLFMDAEGTVLHKVVGGTDVAGLIEHANVANDPSKQIGTMHKKYAEGNRDVKFLSTYIKALHRAYERDKMLPVGEAFIANTPKDKLINVDAFTVIGYSNALKYGSETYKFIVTNKDKFVAAEGIGQENYDGIIGQCISGYLNEKATSCASVEDLKSKIEKTKKDFVSPQQEMVESQLINSYYLSHKEYDKWFESNEQAAVKMLETDKRMGESMLINTAYRVAMDPAFATVDGAYGKAIKLANLALESDKEMLAGYYCLASLYKAKGEKEKAQKNIDAFMTKNEAKGGKNDQRVQDLKRAIEAM